MAKIPKIYGTSEVKTILVKEAKLQNLVGQSCWTNTLNWQVKPMMAFFHSSDSNFLQTFHSSDSNLFVNFVVHLLLVSQPSFGRHSVGPKFHFQFLPSLDLYSWLGFYICLRSFYLFWREFLSQTFIDNICQLGFNILAGGFIVIQRHGKFFQENIARFVIVWVGELLGWLGEP